MSDIKFRKKSEMAGQILIYVLAIIIFSLTLLYGYKAVKYFSERTTEISFLELESNIKNEVEKVKGDTMGTIKKKVLDIPGNYKDVCFVTSYGPNKYHNSISTNYTLISDNIRTAKKNNMFLAPPGDTNFYIGEIEVEGNFKCVSIRGGKITLRLESMGDHIKVSEWV